MTKYPRSTTRTIATLIATALVGTGLLAAATARAAEDLKILISVPTYAYPYFVHMQKQIDDEAAKLGKVTLIKSDGQLSAPKQVSDIEAAVVQGVSGIIVGPNDPNALAPAIRAAIKAGVPVVTIDRPTNGVPEVLAHVSANNVLGSEAQGRVIESLFPSGANIVTLQGVPGDQTAKDRNTGVHNVLGKKKDAFKFVSEQTARFNRDQGLSVTENILTGLATPPQVIVAANDDMALGALQAVKARGLAGKIAILGYDGSPDALAAVKAGTLTATVNQFPGQQGRTALRTLVENLRTKKTPANPVILIEPVAITKSNLDKAERIGEVL
ncbi:MAG: substrate-binding domain-containing protein [Propionivibrio sp.]